MAKTEKFKRIFTKFEKAFSKYEEIIKSEELFEYLSEELIIGISTKRFEYTFESLWHSLKAYLKAEGVEATTPLRCFKEAFKLGLIKQEDEDIFVDMIEKRNQIVHIYDFDQAKEIYQFVKKPEVYRAIKSLYNKLK